MALSSKVVAFLILEFSALSQTITTGEVTGTVRDSSGAVVVDASVVLRSLDTGESRAIRCNTSGMYRFNFLKPGRYEISASSAVLKSDAGTLVVAVGQVESLDVILKPEEAKEVVLVTDTAPLLNTDNANNVYTFSQRQLDLLPLPGGDMVSIAYSIPGVVINNRSGSGNFASPGVGSVSNLFTVNGTDDMDPYTNVNNSGVNGLLLGVNEVQEASVVVNAYEAQYGRQAGAQVNYVTKSGTNSYHGNLVYSYNDALLNGNDFFANTTGTPRPHELSNQYAASLGGFIVKDKLFFFGDTEGLRLGGQSFSSVVSIPSAAFESYSQKAIQPSQTVLYQKMFDLYNSAPGHNRAVPVTNGNGPLQDSTGRLGCGKLTGTPAGNGGTFGVDVSCVEAWGTNSASDISEWLLSTRIDYNLSANKRMFFRFKTDQGYLPAATSPISSLFNSSSTQPDYEGQLNHTWVISPRLVNNFVGAVTYNSYVFSVPTLTAALQAFPLRINLRDGGASASRGIASIGPPAVDPGGRRDGQLQIVDDISYNAGSHFLKAGVNYRYNRESDLSDSAFTYLGVFNIFSLAEFASGVLNGSSPSSYLQNFTANPVLHLRLYNAGFYVQDQWVVTPHLKITVAVRFDRTGNLDCVDACFSRLATPFADISKGSSIPYNQSIQSGLAHPFYNIEPIVPQPRLSLAYNPSWSKNTVFRAGFGEFSDLYPAAFAGGMGRNPPNVFTSFIQTGLVEASGAGSAPAIAAASANAFAARFSSGATLLQLQQAVAPAGFAPPSYSSLPPTVRTPKYVEWSAEIQQQFDAKNVLTIRYQGSHGYDIFENDPNANASADPSVYPNGFVGLPAASPDPRFSAVSQLTNTGYSNFNALAILFRHAFGRGFQGQISYAWSHSLDTISNGGLSSFSYDSIPSPLYSADLRLLNYSNADYDVRHNLTGYFTWEIPMRSANRFIKAALGGWSLATRLNAHTGTPFTIINGGLYGIVNSGLSSSFGGSVVLPDLIDSNIQTTCGHSAVNTPCFTGSEFAPAPTQANFGNLRRNSFRGPGFFNIDSSVYKAVAIWERARFTFGASAYNLLNHPNFLDPNSDISLPGLGLITKTGLNPSGPYGWYGGPSGRAVVVSGKLVF